MKLVKESLVIESEKMEISAGIAIIQDGAILLCHPTNSKWWGTYSIPKGLVEPGENLMDAAIRETREEVGVDIDPKDIDDPEPLYLDYKDENGKIFKRVYYFVAKPETPIDSDGITPDKKEVDWAGFILKDKAKQRISWRQKPILDSIEDEPEEEKEPAESKKEETGGEELGL